MISVFTPFHAKANQFLLEAYDSLLAQSNPNWEWILVPNAGGVVPEIVLQDSRVSVFPVEDDDPEHNRIGRLKRHACSKASGSIYLELDADDILTSTALEEVERAFRDAGVAMVYSNHAEFQNGTWESRVYNEAFGWKARPVFYEGHELQETISWPPSPHMMRQIFWAPNHVRAWRAVAYNAMDGHDEALKTGDDHDLCCRTYIAYGARGIAHIDKCLYLYRLHPENSCTTNNEGVQRQTEQNYLKYSRAMALRWARDEGTQLLDLGGRLNAWEGFTTVDLHDAQVITDLNDPWPFADNSAGVIRASHVFEHLKDPVHAMNEAFRVLAPGGWLFLDVPSTDGRGAFQDPTHVSFWNQNSIWYYTRQEFARFVPKFKGRFQDSRTVTFFPSDFERAHNIPILQSDLIAVKGYYSKRPVGAVMI